MENASKALIIAGAILLSILIISLGIVIYNTAKQTTDSVNLDQQAAETFNSKLTPYIGTGKSATDINDLKALVLSINAEQKNNEGYHYIQMTVSSATWVKLSSTSSFSSSTTWTDSGGYATTNKTYTVTIKDSIGSDGYYDTITVTSTGT